MKGYLKADANSLAWGAVGAMLGLAVGAKAAPKHKKAAAAVGAVAALGARAAFDPELKAERQTA